MKFSGTQSRAAAVLVAVVVVVVVVVAVVLSAHRVAKKGEKTGR